MNLYGLVYGNDTNDFLYLIVKAESHILATREAEENVKQWEGFRVLSVNFINGPKLESGEVVFVGG